MVNTSKNQITYRLFVKTYRLFVKNHFYSIKFRV